MTTKFSWSILGVCVVPLMISTANASAIRCEGLFAGSSEKRLMSFEVETAELVTSSSEISEQVIKTKMAKFLNTLSARKVLSPATSVEITHLKDDNLAVVARGLSENQVAQLEAVVKKSPLTSDLKSYFAKNPQAKLVLSLENAQAQVLVERKSLPVAVSADLATKGTSDVLIFSGKHAYLPLKLSVAAIRSGWDRRYPKNTWQVVGAENVFGTRVEKAERLVGMELIGIAVDMMNEGKAIIERPMEGVKAWEFRGRVLSVQDKNTKGPDPIWFAKVQQADGTIAEIDLNNAVGLRVLKIAGANQQTLSGGEKEAAWARRLAQNEKYRAQNAELPKAKFKVTLHETVESRLSQLPVETREKLQNWRGQMATALAGKTKGAEFLNRESQDVVLRPMKELMDENMRPVVEETHRLLFDTESRSGYNAWLIDFATLIAMDVHAQGRLQWGSRAVTLRDVHWNFPFAEGKHGIPMQTVKLREVPLMSEADLILGIDKFAAHYGFDRNISKLPNLKLQAGTKAVGTLEGVSLEESTPFFFEYSRNHVLFLDNYFKGKPHGQYPHIMQWLYLAERYSQAAQNQFNVPMSESVFKVQSYFMDDMVAGVTVSDFVGQRAPQNPDHVNNTLQMFFPVD